MPKIIKKKKLPEFDNVDEFADFCDSTDMSEHIKDMKEVHADVNLKSISYEIPFDIGTSHKLEKIAKAKNTTTDELIKTWTKEKIEEEGSILAYNFQ
jgi:hypothetical protein